ncbi:uncharacterized protein PAC_14759 [Phialocephala subalpina]|uniref:Uncharacterized protein n=1 Tax=Phialocephala subalpina TaxID=576137 RepID=A0A1L7XIJ8_9HELO|nr:uncharacterized protein PAC_14759 [Phialocephala subalpina]
MGPEAQDSCKQRRCSSISGTSNNFTLNALFFPHDFHSCPYCLLVCCTRNPGQLTCLMSSELRASNHPQGPITDAATSQIVGYSCSNKLGIGSFSDLPNSADVDENGSSTITIGSTTYKVRENPDISGGITCTRVFNAVEMYMTCSASVPSSLDLKPVTKRENCFSSGSPSMDMAATSILNSVGAPPAGNVTTIIGDGNPHQNYLLKQLSENIDCATAPSCSVCQKESMSYTIGWSSSATADEWLTCGFDVSVSWTTGNTYSCTGNSGDTVCVWYNTAHTAYTVQNGAYNDCTRFSPLGGTLVMYSPNSNNVGGGVIVLLGRVGLRGVSIGIMMALLVVLSKVDRLSDVWF